MTGLAIWHVLHGTTALREWQRRRIDDPSGADFYWTELEVEIVFASACFAVAFLVGQAAKRLRRKAEPQRHDAT
jgi:hypothetical protein